MQTRAVLFDLDGTLVDSLPTLTCSLNAYLAALGKAPFTEKKSPTWWVRASGYCCKRRLPAGR